MPTLLQLRTRVRQRTDNEHTGGFVSDAELNQLINTHYKELYEFLVIQGLHRAETEVDITATGALRYALPDAFFALVGVYRQDSAGQPRYYMTRHDHRVYPDVARPAPAQTYRIVGVNIEFNPVPSSGTYKVVYIPVPADMVADADEIDGLTGWDEYVVVKASADVMAKEEGDPGAIGRLDSQARELKDRIKAAAQSVSLSEAPRIEDVRGCGDALSVFTTGSFNVRGYRGSPWEF
jgi:hypothetical protein